MPLLAPTAVTDPLGGALGATSRGAAAAAQVALTAVLVATVCAPVVGRRAAAAAMQQVRVLWCACTCYSRRSRIVTMIMRRAAFVSLCCSRAMSFAPL